MKTGVKHQWQLLHHIYHYASPINTTHYRYISKSIYLLKQTNQQTTTIIMIIIIIIL
jgi:hypothetical protein